MAKGIENKLNSAKIWAMFYNSTSISIFNYVV